MEPKPKFIPLSPGEKAYCIKQSPRTYKWNIIKSEFTVITYVGGRYILERVLKAGGHEIIGMEAEVTYADTESAQLECDRLNKRYK